MFTFFLQYFLSQFLPALCAQELLKNHSGIPHGGFVIRSGVTGWEKENGHVIEYQLKLDSNPEFTASVLVACARAVHRLALKGETGCRTLLDIARSGLKYYIAFPCMLLSCGKFWIFSGAHQT